MSKSLTTSVISIFIGLMLIVVSRVNIKFPKIAHANETKYNYYDDRPYPGVRNFDEWMTAWNKDVKNLLEQQRIEWEEKFGDEI